MYQSGIAKLRSSTIVESKRQGLKQPTQLKKTTVKSSEKKTTEHARKLAQPTNKETVNANKGLKRPSTTKVRIIHLSMVLSHFIFEHIYIA